MCGRITQKTGELPGLTTVTGGPDRSRPPRWNGAPSQDFWIIRKHPHSGLYQRDLLLWGLIPYWCKDAGGGRKPINAKAESIASLPTFRDAYRRRRCLVPVDGFFEWQAIKGQKARQPYAVGMKSSAPFALAAVWENWQRPGTGEWLRTFAIVTTTANELVGRIHDRMPVIIPQEAYDRWLADIEPDPRDLLVPYPSEQMALWPVSSRVNRTENDDPAVLEHVEAA